ncbi:hypothetical protein TNCT_282411 [Trichonephila clavata]|uniref:Ubiquitin-like domain-containing protein n=1 Tax=Trichonephila clavata TaxID=2740835 RepID=A0A8X6I1A0_TRICU|nr:hypothetical protein TNCT_282411 [Trichonephila clavata]
MCGISEFFNVFIKDSQDFSCSADAIQMFCTSRLNEKNYTEFISKMDFNTLPATTQQSVESSETFENDLESKPTAFLHHEEALAIVENEISEIIKSDPLLHYLPSGVTLDELNNMLALEHGRAMTVIVRRADNQTCSVVVEQKATVIDLKKAFQRHFTLKLKREGCERCISWRYIWKTYWLYYAGQKLTENDKPLKVYGIENNSELTFIKRLRNNV